MFYFLYQLLYTLVIDQGLFTLACIYSINPYLFVYVINGIIFYIITSLIGTLQLVKSFVSECLLNEILLR